MQFRDRHDAGVQLARALLPFRDQRPIILSLPRGGVVVGAEVARALGRPLELLAVHKVGAPFQPELALGAVAEGGVTLLDPAVCDALGVSARDAEELAARARHAVVEAVVRRRASHPLPILTDRTVIIVDDGLATGATARAAIAAVTARHPRRVVLAVPVAAAQAAARLRNEVDALVVVHEAADLQAVGDWYRDFRPVTDEEVDALLAAAAPHPREPLGDAIDLPVDNVVLRGELGVPAGARGIVLFAHGSGSGRHSPQDRIVAKALQREGFATLLVDLLSDHEQALDSDASGLLRFDVSLLTTRLVAISDWIAGREALRALPLGYFGSSTGAAAAFVAAAARPERVAAIVSRGGRVDLTGSALPLVRAATLLLVGSDDDAVLELNERALSELRCEQLLTIVDGAGHLFEEPGALETVTQLASRWFADHLRARQVAA